MGWVILWRMTRIRHLMQTSNITKPNILRQIFWLSLVLAMLALSTACGQKGDLYLPPEENQQQD